ncbi:MAG: hypothetical protein FIB03_15355 [Anaerolineae bacterium]|nr:hypothetical protein [Anaerolineae bacterium]
MVWFIQLAPLTDPNSIISAIKKELNIPTHTDKCEPRQQLLDAVQNRQMLLILDNLEHLLDAASISLLTDLINHAPNLKLLTTSRERVNIQGEHLFPGEGLETPGNESPLSNSEADPEQIAFSALQLFEQSARRVQSSFKITQDNLLTVSQICRHLQGMPLAIELAASWTEVLPVEEINREIKQNLDFLQSELHDLPDRQRSLRAIFDSSWQKLTKPTRSTIKALSVFRSGFSRQAAQAIAGISMKTLLDLTNKSWIQARADGRYQIHELLRQFAFELLECETLTYAQVKDHYCMYYSNRLASLWESWKESGQPKALSELEVEFENIKSAWAWSITDRGYETAIHAILPVIFAYSEIRGKFDELMNMVGEMLKLLERLGGDAKTTRAKIVLRTAQGAYYSDGGPIREAVFEGLYPINMEGIREAWSLSKKSIELHELGFWGILLAYIYGMVIDLNEATQRLKNSILHFQEKNDPWELATAKLHLARLLLAPNQSESQHMDEWINQNLTEALDIFSSLEDRIDTAHTLRQIGSLRMRQGKIEDAIKQWQAAHASLLALDVNEWSTASNIEWQIGDAFLQLGQFEKAFECFQDIARINLEHGYTQQAIAALSKESFEKARHGDLIDALRIRQKCLDLIREAGPAYQVAWNEWEMGELMRLTDKPEEAKVWFEHSRQTFENYKDNVGLSFYWRGIGDLALSMDDFEMAIQGFSKSMEFASHAQHNWISAYALNGLGEAALKQNDLRLAEKHLANALLLARKVHDAGIVLTILASMAKLFFKQGNVENAVELGELVHTHFASWHNTKSQALEALSFVQKSMSPKKFNELKKKGRSLDLWKTVDQILAGD